MSSTYSPPSGPLDILYDDHALLAVNKPAGLLSVPGRGAHLADCLITRIQATFPTALLVHRLDRDTSGVMVFALTPHAQRALGQQFEKRQTRKTYVARVWGQVTEKAGTVDLPLIVDWPNRPLQKVCHDTGKPAVKRSTDRPTTCSASVRTPARSSKSASGTPCHIAVPTRSPPTWLETQAMVTGISTASMANNSS